MYKIKTNVKTLTKLGACNDGMCRFKESMKWYHFGSMNLKQIYNGENIISDTRWFLDSVIRHLDKPDLLKLKDVFIKIHESIRHKYQHKPSESKYQNLLDIKAYYRKCSIQDLLISYLRAILISSHNQPYYSKTNLLVINELSKVKLSKNFCNL